jgi:hypothetical protein
MSVQRLTAQVPMGWSNAAASVNMERMVRTRLPSQLPMGWLKELASQNIQSMSTTLPTFQLPMSWSNAEVPRNIFCMVVTEETSHALMSSLKAVSMNRSSMSVTELVSLRTRESERAKVAEAKE